MMCLTSTVAQPEEFYIFIEQRKKKKKEEPQIIYLIFHSRGRHVEISALRDRGLSSLHTWGRIHAIQLQCLKSTQTTENLENGLRPESPHVTVSPVGPGEGEETPPFSSASPLSG